MPIQTSAKNIIQAFVDKEAADLYLTVGAPPSIRVHGTIEPYGSDLLTEDDIRSIMKEIISEEAIAQFDARMEYNTAIKWDDTARLRINIFRQQLQTGMVIRRIRTDIPTLESLELPKIYSSLVMEKRGLILIVGATGSGKSTTMAAMLSYRNQHSHGHIITIEDPVEFLHAHQNCIVTQRDVGVDTESFGLALKNALRQAPDVVLIGEIRDSETMEHAIVFAETGHLCLATLHANNTNQAIERVLNFFPEEKHALVLMNLSLNLKAILSQRLVPNMQNSRSLAIEILLNEGLIKNLIMSGNVKEIRELIEKGRGSGMQTFEQSLLELCAQGLISEDEALAQADSSANMRLAMKQRGIGRYKIAEELIKKSAFADPDQF